MTYRLTWMADVLRAAHLEVLEIPGWINLGHGDVSTPLGVMCHHTAGGLVGDYPSLGVVRNGRPGLQGPLAQLGLGRDLKWRVIAAGRCWHAGKGSFRGVTDGNRFFVGVEAENSGYTTGPRAEPWKEEMLDVYARGCAALLKHGDREATWCIGHKEWAPSRKVDPTFDMGAFRLRVVKYMQAVPVYTVMKPPTTPAIEAVELMLVHGWTPVQAFGWVGNMQQESYEDLRPTVSGDHAEAIGLWQWHGPRQVELHKYADANKVPWDTRSTQILFSLQEPGERRALDKLRAATTVEEAVDAGIAFARPGRPNRERRLALANSLADWYAQKGLVIADAPKEDDCNA